MTESAVQNLKHWLVAQTGLDPSLLDRSSFDRRIQDRVAQLRLGGVPSYERWLHHDAHELERLVEEIAVPETWLFRYPESYELLVRHARSLRKRALPGHRLRMLSIACSTGEEPYSMAMAALHAGWPCDAVVVDAFDRSERAITVARQATYGARAIRGPLPDWAQGWLQPVNHQVCVDTHVVATVTFHHADFLRVPPPPSATRYDIVYCRNLLIYLNKESQKKLIDQLRTWLSSDGLLFVGHAESLESLRSMFRPVDAPFAFAHHPREVGSAPSTNVPNRGSIRRPARSDVQPPIPTGVQDQAEAQPVLGPNLVSDVSLPSLREARVMADEGKLDESLAAAQRIVAVRGPSAAVFELVGSVCTALGKLGEARDAFTKVLYFDPDHEEALLQMAMICEGAGETAQASRYRWRAARSHKKNQREDT